MLVIRSRKLRAIKNELEACALQLLSDASKKVFVGWGRKKSGKSAVAIAARKKKSFLLAEDGFLRSVKRADTPFSLVLDDKGIYYDARQASRLEELIAAPITATQKSLAEQVIVSWRENRLSKYNEANEYTGELPECYVLLIDQVLGDDSVEYGLANADSFLKMLEAATLEHPDKTLVIKIHPDIFSRNKQAHFDVEMLQVRNNVLLISENCHPVRLIAKAEMVYTVTSQVGFEALIWGKPVRCFGMPFYAGWGLTHDEMPAPERRKEASLLALVYAALIAYPFYFHPETGARCDINTIIDYIALQSKMRARIPQEVFAFWFSKWKHPFTKMFFSGSKLKYIRNDYDDFSENSTIVCWGNKTPEHAPLNATFIRVEDGFLRSAGLGAGHTRPLSWAIDRQGLYYDARKPSELETILETHVFTENLLQRARNLSKRILAMGITKYNVPGESWERPTTSQKVLLVPGQVESDASIKYGSADIKTNIDLLSAVRKAHPDAYIIYKPHPDVVAGFRAEGADENDAAGISDEVVTHGDTVQMLNQVDEVHTLTSLIGFEALMRGVAVTCYGRPFYSGWGLTNDIFPLARRTTLRTLEELVAATLILYPTYVSKTTDKFTTPERVLDELLAWRNEKLHTKPSLGSRMFALCLKCWYLVRKK